MVDFQHMRFTNWMNGVKRFGLIPQLFSVNHVYPIHRRDKKTVIKKPKYLLMFHFSCLYLLLEEPVSKMIKRQSLDKPVNTKSGLDYD